MSISEVKKSDTLVDHLVSLSMLREIVEMIMIIVATIMLRSDSSKRRNTFEATSPQLPSSSVSSRPGRSALRKVRKGVKAEPEHFPECLGSWR